MHFQGDQTTRRSCSLTVLFMFLTIQGMTSTYWRNELQPDSSLWRPHTAETSNCNRNVRISVIVQKTKDKYKDFKDIFFFYILILFLKKDLIRNLNKMNLLTSMPPTYRQAVLGRIKSEKTKINSKQSNMKGEKKWMKLKKKIKRKNKNEANTHRSLSQTKETGKTSHFQTNRPKKKNKKHHNGTRHLIYQGWWEHFKNKKYIY